MEHYSINKKNETMSFAAIWMTLEIIILIEESQIERKLSMVSSKYVTHMNLFSKWKQIHRHRK